MSITVRKTDLGDYRVHTPYSARHIMRQLHGREWDPLTRSWIVDEFEIDAAVTELRHAGYRVDTDHRPHAYTPLYAGLTPRPYPPKPPFPQTADAVIGLGAAVATSTRRAATMQPQRARIEARATGYKTEHTPKPISIQPSGDAQLAYALGRISGRITMLHEGVNGDFDALRNKMNRMIAVEEDR